jgi:hypothetical protein
MQDSMAAHAAAQVRPNPIAPLRAAMFFVGRARRLCGQEIAFDNHLRAPKLMRTAD